jgi:hypothetical protein
MLSGWYTHSCIAALTDFHIAFRKIHIVFRYFFVAKRLEVLYIQSRGGREHTPTPLAKTRHTKKIGSRHWLVDQERYKEIKMVRSQNNNGHTAFAMVINLALVAVVFAGIVAAVSSLAA